MQWKHLYARFWTYPHESSLMGRRVMPALAFASKEVPMVNDLEKRISARHPIEGPITLNSPIGSSNEVDAHLLNFSKQGMCFTTKTKLTPGTTVLFKASKKWLLSAEEDADCQLRSISMVTVRWCQESSLKNQPVYIIGANYMIHY
jgi:hypothetical protein